MSRVLLLNDLGPVSRKSHKLFGSDKPFLKLRSAYSRKLVFYYDFKIRKGKFVAKFHVWKSLCFCDTKEILSPEIRPKSFGSFVKCAPGLKRHGHLVVF